MPISGLPDPTIHRKCKRCGTWFHLHEVVLAWPPKRGPLSFIHVTLAESTEQDRERKFYCLPCQDLNALDARRFRRLFTRTGLTMLAVLVAIPIAYWLGVFAELESFLRGI